MSRENVEIVRRWIYAYNRRDFGGVAEVIDPDFDFRSAVEQKSYRGIAGLARYSDEVDALIENFHIEDDRFVDVGEDRVLHLYRVLGRGAGSGVPVSRHNAIVWQLRAGKLLTAQVYLDQRQALEAVGLSEQDAHADS
jgi:ketosteroid isomerase-like protein